jgi:hypothetical protein
MITLGHLDVNVVLHCNSRCVSCSHASPFMPASWAMTPTILKRDLAALKQFVHFSVIQMVGGEPTLLKDLVEMIGVAKSSGVGNSVSVITNGKLLPRMGDDFWRAIDWLQLSIYPTLEQKTIDLAKAKCAEFGKPFYSTLFTEFHQQIRASPSDGSNFHSCHWKTNCFTVHNGAFYLCPQSVFFPRLFMGLEASVDGLPLVGLTEDVLSDFIHRKKPFNACRICAANEMNPRAWAEAKTYEEWRRESTLR